MKKLLFLPLLMLVLLFSSCFDDTNVATPSDNKIEEGINQDEENKNESSNEEDDSKVGKDEIAPDEGIKWSKPENV